MTDDKLADEIERQVNHPGNLARMGIAAPKVVWFKDDAYWQQIIAALRRSDPPSWDKMIADLKAVVASLPSKRQPESDKVLVPRSELLTLASDCAANRWKNVEDRVMNLLTFAAAKAEGHHE